MIIHTGKKKKVYNGPSLFSTVSIQNTELAVVLKGAHPETTNLVGLRFIHRLFSNLQGQRSKGEECLGEPLARIGRCRNGDLRELQGTDAKNCCTQRGGSWEDQPTAGWMEHFFFCERSLCWKISLGRDHDVVAHWGQRGEGFRARGWEKNADEFQEGGKHIERMFYGISQWHYVVSPRE